MGVKYQIGEGLWTKDKGHGVGGKGLGQEIHKERHKVRPQGQGYRVNTVLKVQS